MRINITKREVDKETSIAAHNNYVQIREDSLVLNRIIADTSSIKKIYEGSEYSKLERSFISTNGYNGYNGCNGYNGYNGNGGYGGYDKYKKS